MAGPAHTFITVAFASDRAARAQNVARFASARNNSRDTSSR